MTRAVLLAAALLMVPGCDATDGGAGDGAGLGRAEPPEAFFAVLGVGTRIVEVDSDSGRIRRTLVDLGDDPEAVADTGGLIDGLDLAADGRVLYFSRYTPEPGSVYRIELPDGTPARVTDGHGASLSPDGHRLALIRQNSLVILDLPTGHERVLDHVVGELGAARTAWDGDSRRLAVEISGADVSVIDIVDSDTGETTDLVPVGELEVNYRVMSPRFRPSDGALGVICCHDGDIGEGDPPQNAELVLHDPATGVEQSRVRLPFSAWGLDWDAGGSALLLTDGDRVHEYRGGRFRTVPSIGDVWAVAW